MVATLRPTYRKSVSWIRSYKAAACVWAGAGIEPAAKKKIPEKYMDKFIRTLAILHGKANTMRLASTQMEKYMGIC